MKRTIGVIAYEAEQIYTGASLMLPTREHLEFLGDLISGKLISKYEELEGSKLPMIEKLRVNDPSGLWQLLAIMGKDQINA